MQSPFGNIDIMRLARELLRRLWAIILVGIIVGGCFYVFAKARFVPLYSSKAVLAFTITSYVDVVDGDNDVVMTKQVKDFYSKEDIERYSYLIKSDKMVGMVKESLEQTLSRNYSEAAIRSSLTVAKTDVTGIFEIRITGADPEFINAAMAVIIEIYPEYLQTFNSGLGTDVINAPTSPTVKNSDGATKTGFIGFIIGAALIAVIVVLTELLNNTVRSINDIRNKINIKILGTVPYIEVYRSSSDEKSAHPGLLITDERTVNFDFVENFKAIRTKIENINSQNNCKIFAITSTFEDEGKTTVTTNIACALAQKGKSVLLIDCDLRKPAVLKNLGVKEDKNYGLLPIIKGTSTYEESVKFIKSVGIFVLPTGGITSMSTEILDVEKVHEVFDKAREEFDYIIIDTPPARIVTDCMVLAPFVDSIIYAIRNDYAKIQHISETIEEVASTGVNMAGAILTMAPMDGYGKYYRRKRYRYSKYYKSYGGYGRYGSGKGSYGSYGYGYGYGNKSYGYGYGYGYGKGYGRRKKRGYGGYGGYGYGKSYGYGGYGGYGNSYGYGGYGRKSKKEKLPPPENTTTPETLKDKSKQGKRDAKKDKNEKKNK